ncbi:hypothetical protein GCM10009665_44980 [Kitasatospora nipponensis]|uniref:DUF2269 family protein n=1 Tax=Kitasatospora nipponensis TaxID=258049 RepID=A0ABN1WGJ0_9ACTN
MTLAPVLLICHVTAALVLLASLVTDWIGVAGLRSAWTSDQVREPLRAIEVSAAFGPLARITVLAAGLWLAITAWSWQGWIIAGLIGWSVLVVLGEPLTGKDMRAMVKAVRAEDGALSADTLARVHDPRLWSSVLTRTGVVTGVLICMLDKPGWITGLGAQLGGYLLGIAAAKLTPQPERPQPQPPHPQPPQPKRPHPQPPQPEPPQPERPQPERAQAGHIPDPSL